MGFLVLHHETQRRIAMTVAHNVIIARIFTHPTAQDSIIKKNDALNQTWKTNNQPNDFDSPYLTQGKIPASLQGQCETMHGERIPRCSYTPPFREPQVRRSGACYGRHFVSVTVFIHWVQDQSANPRLPAFPE